MCDDRLKQPHDPIHGLSWCASAISRTVDGCAVGGAQLGKSPAAITTGHKSFPLSSHRRRHTTLQPQPRLHPRPPRSNSVTHWHKCHSVTHWHKCHSVTHWLTQWPHWRWLGTNSESSGVKWNHFYRHTLTQSYQEAAFTSKFGREHLPIKKIFWALPKLILSLP